MKDYKTTNRTLAVFIIFSFFIFSCGSERTKEEISPTKIVYDSLFAYIQKQPMEENVPNEKDTVVTKEETEEVSDSLKVEQDSTGIVSEKSCDLFLEKLSDFSKKLTKSIKKKKDDPANEEFKKEYRKRKEEYFLWVKRVKEKSSESSWQKNRCYFDEVRKQKAEKIIIRMEEEMKR